jgi:hypothetical protein
MTRNVLLAITVAAILIVWNKKEPEEEPEEEPDEEPEAEPEEVDPAIINKVKSSGIKGMKIGRRMGFKNRIHIKNLSKFYRFKIKYRSHAVVSGLTIKWCSADFNTDYEWGEVTLYPSEEHVIEEDTWRCDIHVIRINPDGSEDPDPIFKGLVNSSKDLTIVDRRPMMSRGMRGCFPF